VLDKGEFYFDEKRKENKLKPEWALKDIEHWWVHVQYIILMARNTLDSIKSKKIWFAELGFPSVSASTNQPNVFFDASSLESNFPKG
ncbi:hypothetical protein MHYMCMPSP_00976, partial [Hyalomma marginatum]